MFTFLARTVVCQTIDVPYKPEALRCCTSADAHDGGYYALIVAASSIPRFDGVGQGGGGDEIGNCLEREKALSFRLIPAESVHTAQLWHTIIRCERADSLASGWIVNLVNNGVMHFFVSTSFQSGQ